MGTKIVEVRKGLVAKIAALDLSGSESGQVPRVSFGYEVGRQDREQVWTQRARFTQRPASLRASTTYRDEEGRFEVTIKVEGIDLSQEDTSDRACAIALPIENLIATHASWPSVDGMTALFVDGEAELTEAFNEHGTLAVLSIPVRYTARITT